MASPALATLGTLLRIGRRVSSCISLRLMTFPRRKVGSCPDNTRLVRRTLGVNTSIMKNVPRFRFAERCNITSVGATFSLTRGCSHLISVRYSRVSSRRSHFIRMITTRTCRHKLNDQMATDRAATVNSCGSTCACGLFELLGLSGVGFITGPLMGVRLRNHFSACPGHEKVAEMGRLLRTKLGMDFNRSSVFSP